MNRSRLQVVPKPKTGAGRRAISADRVAPVVRQIAHDEFFASPDSERIAGQHGNSRCNVIDAVVYERGIKTDRRIDRIERFLGMKEAA